MPDTLWHLAGWAIALLGAPLLARALLAARAKGRRRCPKCWYGMDGVPATPPDAAHPSAAPTYLCPECGHTARSEKALLKTRRRLKLLPLTLVALVVGYTTWTIPRIKREGAIGLVPTTWLILSVPYPETDFFAPQTERHKKFQNTLRARTFDPKFQHPPELYWWQCHLWDLSLYARFAPTHRFGVPDSAQEMLATLDATTVTLPPKLHFAALADLIQRASGVPIHCDDLGSVVIEPDSQPSTATAALDKACDAFHQQADWSFTDSGVALSEGAHTQPVLCTYAIADLLEFRHVRAFTSTAPVSAPSIPYLWRDNSLDLLEAIHRLVYPDTWVDNGGDQSYASIAGSRLHVVADPIIQVRITQFLDALRTAKRTGQATLASSLRPTDLNFAGNPANTVSILEIKETLENTPDYHFVCSQLRSIEPDIWEENGGNEARLCRVGNLIIIHAPPQVHPLIRDKAELLRTMFSRP